MRVHRIILFLATALTASTAAPRSGAAAEVTWFHPGTGPALVEFSAGAFAAFGDGRKDLTGLFQIDGVSSYDIADFWGLMQVNPYVGAWINGKAGKMGYGGLQYTVPVASHVELAAFTGIGAYDRGDSRDMGSTALFQTGLTARYVFDSGYRLGITISHESNGGILPRKGDGCVCNPGANNLLVTLAVPFAKLVPASLRSD